MATSLSVGVIFGGRSGEHEVSLMSAESVIAVLRQAGYAVIEIGITPDGLWLTGKNVLASFQNGNLTSLTPAYMLPSPNGGRIYATGTCHEVGRVDVVFPVLHGTYGEDGTIQGIMELADIAYVGAGVLASSVGMDKALFKEIMRQANVPVLDSVLLSRAEITSNPLQCKNLVESLGGYPVFVKPANLGSSVGISKVRNPSELEPALAFAAAYDRRVLVERGISPREIEVSVLGNNEAAASVPGEIVPGDEFYSYRAKYVDGTSKLIIPAPVTSQQADQLRALAIRAYRAIDCCGLARVDFLIDKVTGETYVSEINTMPGFTRISMYPKLWEATGLSYASLIDRLITLAQERKADRDQTQHHYGGMQ